MPESVQLYELVPDDERYELEARPGPVARPRLVIALAFVVGIALGVAGLSKQQDSQASRTRQAEVSLVAVLTEQLDVTRGEYRVRIYNAGSLAVRLGPTTLVVPGYERSPRAEQAELPPKREVRPGAWATLPSSTGAPDCTATVPDGDPRLTVQVMTADEATRQVEVPVLDAYGNLTSVRTTECEAILHPERTVNAWPLDVSYDAGTATVRMVLQAETWGREPVEITGVQAKGDLDVRAVTELPITVQPNAASASDSVTIRVEIPAAALCGLQLSDAPLALETRYRDQTATAQAWFDPMTFGQISRDACARPSDTDADE